MLDGAFAANVPYSTPGRTVHFSPHLRNGLRHARAFTFALAALLALALTASGAEPKLTAEDAKYLDKLIADFLFDPTGAERVTGEFPYYSVWGRTGTMSRDGWLVRGKGGQGNRVFFTDGESEPARRPQSPGSISLWRVSRVTPPPGEKETPEGGCGAADKRTSAGVNWQSDLVLAAWLHKFGHDGLAVQALAAERKSAVERARGDKVPDPREVLRSQLAESAFVDLVDAYMNRGDEAALAHGNRLFKLYKDVARSGSDYLYRQAEQVLGELLRRKAEGRFGPDANRLAPNDLPTDPNKRIAALIGALDEVDARQWSQPGGVTLDWDWRVRALIECGEGAVPVLLTAYETDTRLTRSVSFGRDYVPYRNVHPVREAVLLALEGILRVRAFEPTAKRAEDAFLYARTVAEQMAVLRRYWREYGKLPFDERMMKILTDPEFECGRVSRSRAQPGRARARAPDGLARSAFVCEPDREEVRAPDRRRGDRRASTGEWRLAFKMNEDPWARAWVVGTVEKEYLGALVTLGDERAAPILAARAAGATDTNTRRRFAVAAFRLGESKPLDELARAFEAGALVIRDPDYWRTRAGRRDILPSFEDIDELADLVRDLSAAAIPSADMLPR